MPNEQRPILFSAPMVRALLAGTKTQTRRAINPQPDTRPGMECTRLLFKNRKGELVLDEALEAKAPRLCAMLCPYGAPGDHLWVREAWRADAIHDGKPPRDLPHTRHIQYEAGRHEVMWPAAMGKLRPSMFMPRWASRILLEVTEVRVERLQDISEADARAEGITDGGCTRCGEPEPCGCAAPAPSARDAYYHLWGQINGPDSWTANPWVWVVGFTVIAPEDAKSQAARGR